MQGLARSDAAAGERRQGPLLRLDPRLRIVLAALFAVVTVGLGDLRALAAALVLAALAALLARLPLKATLVRLLAVDGFLVPVLLLLPFTHPGTPVASLGPWPVTAEGLAHAVAILVTATAVVLALLALVGSIEPALLGPALAGLGLPEPLTRLFILTTRYIPVLHGELARLRLAMKARAFRPRGDRHTWRSYGYLFGMLLVRSFERSERIVAAMLCRGYSGRPVGGGRGWPGGGQFAVAAAVSVLLIVLGLADHRQ